MSALEVSHRGTTPHLFPLNRRALEADAVSAPALGRPLVDVLQKMLRDPDVSYAGVCDIVRLIGRIKLSPDGCWHWIGYRNHAGYGVVRETLAHRVIYSLVNGVIPDGLHVDHLCSVRHCVNPDHLEPVTPAENSHRGRVGHVNREKTHCAAGHPFTDANTRLANGRRICRTCSRAWTRHYRNKVAACQ